MESLFYLVAFTVMQMVTSTDMFSGDGSGESSSPTPQYPELQCTVPDHITLRPRYLNMEAADILTEGRCFLGCITMGKYTDDEAATNNSTSPLWPFLTVPKNCSVSQDVHECVRGCWLIHATMYRTIRQCGPQCVRECRDTECNNMQRCMNPDEHDPWIHSECPIACVQNAAVPDNACLTGCRTNLSASLDPPPPTPVGPPALIQGDSTGQFTVDLSDAVPDIQNVITISEQQPVVLLFKLEEVHSHDISFVWLVNPSTQLLDLSGHVCKELLVSFAVTNKAAISNFSLPTRVMVGVIDDPNIPFPPRNLRFSDEIDKRVGYFGHVILTILWDKPPNGAYLKNFTVQVSTIEHANMNTCGSGNWSMTFSADHSSAKVMADSHNSLPVMSCVYNVQVYSDGVDGSSSPLEGTYAIKSQLNRSTSDISFGCKRIWDFDNYLFWFNLTWTLPNYLGHGNAIRGFTVKPRMRDISTRPPRTFDDLFPPVIVPIQFYENNSLVVSKVLFPNETGLGGSRSRRYHEPRSDNSLVFLFEGNVTWNTEDLSYVPSRFQTSYDYECSESTQSPSPTPVRNVTVTSFSTVGSSEITINLVWMPPAYPNGELAPYNVCVGASPLEPGEEIQSNAGHFCTFVDEDSATSATITLFYIKQPGHECLYVQMRANNLFVSGNWSDAAIVYLHKSGLCQVPAPANFPVAIVVGPALGGALLAVLLLCCICFCTCYVKMLRRRKRLWKITQEYSDPMFDSGPKRLVLEWADTETSLLTSPLLDQWEIPPNEVIIEDCLGEGAFGEVYKGIVKCPIVNPKVKLSAKNPICTPVAIKLLKKSAKGSERQDFLSEIEMMKKVAEGQNPHVVCLLGCVTIQEPLCLITEFIKYGDLLSYLRTNRRMYTNTNTEEDDANDAYIQLGNVTPRDLVSFSYQISSGMEYLSNLGIVHRDLACRNILVDDGKVLKITDFGMSRETDEIYVQKRTGRVPLKWMAIESIIAREFTSASDVWSYGITLWEIGTLGGFPYHSIHNEDLLSLLKRGYRMEKPDNCAPEVYEIMLMCWNEDPRKRPTFKELRATFDSMLLAEREDAYIDLRINNDKPYYMLDTSTTLETVESFRLCPSPVPGHHNFLLSQLSSKEGSPKPLPTPDFSPSKKSQKSCASEQFSPTAKSNLMRSSSSVGTRQNDNEGQRRGVSLDNAHTNGRPSSLLLPRERERRDKQNPYVEEPSRAAAATLTLPRDIASHTRGGSDGAIEMTHYNGTVHGMDEREIQNLPEIQITTVTDDKL